MTPVTDHPDKLSESPRLLSSGPSLHKGMIVATNGQIFAYIQMEFSKRYRVSFKLRKVLRTISTYFGPQKAMQPSSNTKLASARARDAA